MKKTLSFILALVMCLSLSVTAFAAEGDQTGSTTIQAVVPAPSYTIHVPATVTLEYGNTEVQEVGTAYVTGANNIPDGKAIWYKVEPNYFEDLSDGNNSIDTELWFKWKEDEWQTANVTCRQTCYTASGEYINNGITWGIKVPSWDAAPGTYTTSIVFNFYIDYDMP